LNLWRTKGQAPPPYYLELLREQATHPMPKAGDIEGTVFVQQKVPFGKVSLNCITLSQPFLPTKLVPVGLFPMYCFDPDKDLLRASFEFGKQTVLLNNLILFQQRVVARGIAVLQGTDKIAVAEIPTLELSQAPDSMFVAGDDLTKEPPGPVRVSSGTMSGALASRVEPIYPDTAKKDHISGVVVLRAVIGPDGHVHSLKIVSAPRADLAMAAVAAIQQWVYKPYLLLDVPTDVETTINVAFVLSPGY
jgi:TonB family protein